MKQRPDASTKPYYRCLSCARFRKLCGGRPTRDMDLKNWCEYICDVMDIYHLSCAYVSKEADVSPKTMERIRSINIDQDIMRSTARRIEQVVLGPVGEHTCCIDHNDSAAAEKINQLMQQVEFLRKENDRKAKIIDKYIE